jgi:hypothetical protein
MWLMIATVVALCGCGAANISEPNAAGGSLPTHTRVSLGDAGLGGILIGRPDCLWLDYPDGVGFVEDEEVEGAIPTALIFPSGTTSGLDGEDIVVFDEDGHEIARTGQFVSVGGEGDPEASSCLEASEAGAPWLVSYVGDVCAPDEVTEDFECP